MTIRTLLRSALFICVLVTLSAGQAFGRPPDRHAWRPSGSVDIGFFYDALEPDGDWMWIEPLGWVWAPNAVSPFWRPYTVGRWAFTDWGWTWVSAERWGWATEHYGRWTRVRRYGWVWVPGDVWGPAWVAWRYGPGVVGWAPLPPEARFSARTGLDWGGIDIDVAIRLDTWCFVDDLRFVDANIHRYAYPVGRNTTVIRGTRDVTRVRLVGGRIVNEGVDRADIERRARRPIPLRRVVDDPGSDRRTTRIAADEVRVYRPEVRPGRTDATPPRGRRPAEPTEPPASPWIRDDTGRRWDRRWNQDWDKLEKLQRRDEPVRTTPPQRPRPEVLEKVRDENYEAAENAYRELLATRERANRKAERQPQKGGEKNKDKGGRKER